MRSQKIEDLTTTITRSSYTNMAKNLREIYPFVLPIQSRWADNDQYSHISNVCYYNYADSAINTYLIDKCGLEPSDTRSKFPIGLMIASSCRFIAPLSFPAVVQAGLCIRKVGTSSVNYETAIWEETTSNGQTKQTLAAIVKSTHVFVDRETRIPIGKGGKGAMPAILRDGLLRIVVAESASAQSQAQGGPTSKL
ncbi:hypothetical protein OC846_000863 [Tilletia horrida]|uniref:Thioesterase domain-containing protein n=1 Tax=Tilletia horrida TaxID=155126 RepID=A0AAN6GX15_9BASI|nr:hypothetical protein OC845_001182 [Tilletia horrida]KAK0556836.1 hypothetical protein OC846_000863 [Tilletia horrida]KAK0569227.1 hypothetical protein OC861_001153 [Tilletia horrida]